MKVAMGARANVLLARLNMQEITAQYQAANAAAAVLSCTMEPF